jgi:hypothetical protein
MDLNTGTIATAELLIASVSVSASSAEVFARSITTVANLN